MKKRIAMIALILLIAPSLAFAFDWSGRGSKEGYLITTSSAQSKIAVTGDCLFHGIIWRTDGSTNTTINVYANTDSTGKTLIPTDTVAVGSGYHGQIIFEKGIQADDGIYVKVSTNSIQYQILYRN
jgi:hypothetical protein